MRRNFSIAILAGVAGATLLAGQVLAADPPKYKLVTEIAVGGEGSWDFLNVDAAARRLYAAHGQSVVVIDLDKNTVVGTIPDLPGVHAFLPIPGLGKGYSSNGTEAKSTIVDLKTLKPLGKVETGPNPDAMLYDPGAGEVYTFNATAPFSATVIAARTGAVKATIPMPGKPELAVLDPAVGRIYDAVQDKNVVVAIDTKTHAIVETWPTAPCEAPTGQAIDLKHHRLFVGCGNGKLALMDSRNGKVITSVDAGTGNDGVEFDAATGLVFSSETNERLTIAAYSAPDALKVVQVLPTPWRAKTMTFDPVTHRIYVSAGRYEPLPPTTPGAPAPRPTPIPGSFKVLVFGPAR